MGANNEFVCLLISLSTFMKYLCLTVDDHSIGPRFHLFSHHLSEWIQTGSSGRTAPPYSYTSEVKPQRTGELSAKEKERKNK